MPVNQGVDTDMVLTVDGQHHGPAHNLVILIGNLATNPEIEYFHDRRHMVRFRLCVPSKRSRNEKSYRYQLPEYYLAPCFTDVYLFNRGAENVAAHLSVGRMVMVEGELRCHFHTTEDGTALLKKQRGHFVLAERVIFLDKSADRWKVREKTDEDQNDE